jgi:hypothetical protein
MGEKLRIAASIGMLTVMDPGKLESMNVTNAAKFVVTVGLTAQDILERCMYSISLLVVRC